MGLAPAEVLFVGDFEFDMLSGRRAGTRTVLLRSGTVTSSAHADLVVDSLGQLRCWLEAQGERGSGAARAIAAADAVEEPS
jgi:phosphoglycolate phosphatase-like HAD superfamily hydrolase